MTQSQSDGGIRGHTMASGGQGGARDPFWTKCRTRTRAQRPRSGAGTGLLTCPTAGPPVTSDVGPSPLPIPTGEPEGRVGEAGWALCSCTCRACPAISPEATLLAGAASPWGDPRGSTTDRPSHHSLLPSHEGKSPAQPCRRGGARSGGFRRKEAQCLLHLAAAL